MENNSKRKKRRILPILICLIGVIVIVYAFIEESIRSNPLSQNGENRGPSEGIQASIDELDWITPMFLTRNPNSRPGTKLDEVKGIVIHYIGNPNTTALQNRNYFENLATTKETSASSNFIVCLDGSIIQCVPVDEVAYASNNRNNDTLSIEICHPDYTGEFTEASYNAAVTLTAWLCVQYELTTSDILRHYDITGKECPRYFVQNEEAWMDFKTAVAIAIRNMDSDEKGALR
ncbi:MAG: peptidoglycan recognition protein family protein [Oscillospiraceae bacterium]|nr:peptidoglycan recognition protein family protein [Oscillospiraceae bacterium]